MGLEKALSVIDLNNRMPDWRAHKKTATISERIRQAKQKKP
jgi:hypothetical protein